MSVKAYLTCVFIGVTLGSMIGLITNHFSASKPKPDFIIQDGVKYIRQK